MREAKYGKLLTISLSEEVYSQVKQTSDEKHVSMADYVRKVLVESFSPVPKSKTNAKKGTQHEQL